MEQGMSFIRTKGSQTSLNEMPRPEFPLESRGLTDAHVTLTALGYRSRRVPAPFRGSKIATRQTSRFAEGRGTNPDGPDPDRGLRLHAVTTKILWI